MPHCEGELEKEMAWRHGAKRKMTPFVLASRNTMRQYGSEGKGE